MNLVILLFAVGVLLLGFEVFVPGGLLGVLGALSMIGGIVMAFVDFGAGPGLTAVGAALVLVVLMLVAEFVILPRTAIGRRLFLTSAVQGSSQGPLADAAAVVGAAGETLTTLAPTGYVQVAGKRYEAFSQSGLLTKGTSVRVVGVDNFRLIVTKT